MFGDPDVMVAFPIPEAGRPHITVPRLRHAFKSWRRRGVAEDNVQADLRHRLRRQKRRRAEGDDCRYRVKSVFHLFLLVVLLDGIYQHGCNMGKIESIYYM